MTSWAMAIACLFAANSAQAQVVYQPIRLKMSDAPVEIRIEVKASGPRRIVFASLRSTAPLARVEFVAPSGRIAWSSSGPSLELLPASQAVRPELGAVYRLEEIRDAAVGTWRIRFVPAALKSRAKPGVLTGAYTVRPRFELMLPIDPMPVQAGKITVFEVLATDNGEAMSGIPGIRLWIEDSSGRTIIRTRARTGLRNANGILLNQDDRIYLAVTTLPTPGRYRVMAAHDFGAGDVVATLPLVVK